LTFAEFPPNGCLFEDILLLCRCKWYLLDVVVVTNWKCARCSDDEVVRQFSNLKFCEPTS